MKSERWVRVAELVYGWFGIVLPRGFREEWWQDAREMFRDGTRSAVATRGVRVLPLLVTRGVMDLLLQAFVMRREAHGKSDVADADRAIPVRRGRVWDELRSDVRHAVRALLRTPGFTLAALATLAVGVGVNAAMFGVVNGVLLAPLPHVEAERLVLVWERNLERGWPRYTVSPANWEDWRTRATLFEGMAAYVSGTATLSTGGEPERVRSVDVDAALFDVLRVQPLLGGVFTADAQAPGSEDVVVLSHRLWAGRFGGDASLVGQTIRVDDRSVRVAGVLAPDFAFQAGTDLWRPLVFPFDVQSARGAHYLSVLARLAPGAAVASAQAQMDAISGGLARDHADTNAGWSAVVVPLREQLVGGVERALLVLWGAVAFVLLIACANVVNLLLARGTARRAEFGVRKALGAGPARLARQLVVESLVLAVSGAMLGIGLALALTRVLVVLNPGNLPRTDGVAVDLTVGLYTAAIAILVGVAIGLIMAVQASRTDATAHLAAGSRRAAGGSQRVRRALLVGEIALAMVMLTGFGLLAKSLATILAVNTGFTSAGLITARVSPPSSRYPEAANRAAFYDAVLERLRAAPVVTSASVVTRVPLTGSFSFGFEVDDGDVPGPAEWASGQLRAVEPSYFTTMGIRVVSGRGFTNADGANAPPVVIVNETLARTHLVDRDPIGSRLLVSSGDASCPCEVIGVVADVRELALDAPPAPIYYLPQAQSIWTTRTLIVRSAAPLETVVRTMREAVAAVDAEIALYDVQPLDRVVAAALASPRSNAVLFAIFAALALLLAALGVYGVMSYLVGQRTRELGVRSALGAHARTITWLVEREALAVTATGIALGLLASVLLTRSMSSMLFAVRPLDAGVLLGVSGFLALVSAGAAGLPALRAGRIDPARALRSE